jgi:transposase
MRAIAHLAPDAAGIDVSASELFVAVSPDRDPQPVRSFPTFTRDLNALPTGYSSAEFVQ